MNIFKAVSVGYAILNIILGLESGQPSEPIRIGSQWFEIREVPAPGTTSVPEPISS